MKKNKLILCVCIFSIYITIFGQNFVLLNSSGNLATNISVVILMGILIFAYKVIWYQFFKIGKINENGVLYNKDKTLLEMFNASDEEYVIPNSVVHIRENAFYKSNSLSSITIPNSVTSIGDYAFGDCINLKNIYLQGRKPILINETVFYNVNKNTCILHVPIDSKEKYAKADGWRAFKNIEEEVNKEFESVIK